MSEADLLADIRSSYGGQAANRGPYCPNCGGDDHQHGAVYQCGVS